MNGMMPGSIPFVFSTSAEAIVIRKGFAPGDPDLFEAGVANEDTISV